MKIELFNSEYAGITTFTTHTHSDINDFLNNNKRMVFILRGFNSENTQFLLYASYKYENCINRLLREEQSDIKIGTKNKYTITLEEGY